MRIVSEEILHTIAGGSILGGALVADGGLALSAGLFALAAICIVANYIINGEA